MPEVKIPLIGPAWDSRCKDISVQITRGMYPEINPEGKSVVSLHAFPGLKEFSDLTDEASGSDTPPGPTRALHVMNDRLWALSGNYLKLISKNGTATYNGIGFTGTAVLVGGTDDVEIEDNGTIMVIANGSELFFCAQDGDKVSRPQQLTDTDVSDVSTVAYLNSQFVIDATTKTQFQTSQVTSALSISDFADAVDIATPTSHPGELKRIVAHSSLAYFFKAKGREAWWNSGLGDPPFDRVNGSVRGEGITGKWAVADDKDDIFFLDETRTPRRLRGFASVPIGNPALGKEFASYSTVDDAIGLVYSIDSVRFFELIFPTADRTWVWHEPSNSWFELSSGVDRQRHAVQHYAFAYGKHIFSHPTESKLYELDFDTFTDAGGTVRRVRRTANIHGGLYGRPGAELIFERVEFDVETGVGLTTGQGSDPQLMVRYSDDSGRTWSSEEWLPLGVGGSYLTTVTLSQQGRAFNRVYELAYSEPTRFSLLGARAEISYTT